jgi:outer membrane protein assembly factor BamB
MGSVRRSAAAAIAVLALTALVGCDLRTVPAPEATTSQVNASHTAHSTTGLSRTLTVRWRATLPGFVFGGSATSGSRVFAVVSSSHEGGTGMSSEVVALSHSTGELLWRTGQGYDDLRRWVAATGDGVFTVNSSGVLQRLDPATGEVVWSAGAPGTVGSAPVPYDGRIYLSSYVTSGWVTAYDAKTGKVAWSTEVHDASGSSAPAVRADGVYVTGACGNTYRVGTDGGKVVWHHTGPCVGGSPLYPAVVFGDRLWYRSGDPYYAPILDARTGKQVTMWRSPTSCSPMVTDESVIYPGLRIVARGPISGRLRWSRDFKEGLGLCPVSAGDRILQVNKSGRLVAINRHTGKTVQRLSLDVEPVEVQQGPVADPNVGGGLALLPFGDQLIAVG